MQIIKKFRQNGIDCCDFIKHKFSGKIMKTIFYGSIDEHYTSASMNGHVQELIINI